MMGENPSYSYWWSLNGKLQPPAPSQQAYNNNPPTNNFLSTPPMSLPPPLSVPPPSSLNHHPYHLFGSSLVVPAAANPNALADQHQYHQENQQDLPVSWSQLLLSGLAANDQEHNLGGGQQQVKHGYEESCRQLLYNYNNINNKNDNHHHVININNKEEEDHQLEAAAAAAAACSSSNWSASQLINNPVPSVVGSSSRSSSCMSLSSTSTTTNYMFDFSSKINVHSRNQHTNQYSSQYDDSTSTSGSGASKKPRTFHSPSTLTQPPPSMGNDTFVSGTSKRARAQNSSSTQTPLKVRKEKLGDRISALHQLVSPFGKTDTASVLLEATAQIRFLEGQIQALCSPYMNLGNHVSGSCTRHQHSSASDGKAAAAAAVVAEKQVDDELASRGLCLVPVTCLDDIDTTNMTSNGAEFWTPALGGGF